jgi:hypothetical protein
MTAEPIRALGPALAAYLRPFEPFRPFPPRSPGEENKKIVATRGRRFQMSMRQKQEPIRPRTCRRRCVCGSATRQEKRAAA